MAEKREWDAEAGFMHRFAAGNYRASRGAARSVLRVARARGDRRSVAKVTPIGEWRRVYHFHVRKSGGTSLNRAFLGLGGEDPAVVHWRMRGPLHATRSHDLVFVAHDEVLLSKGQYFFGWHHAPAWAIELPPETFTLTVLRDPASRVLSLYRYLTDPHADEHQPFRAGRAERSLARQGFEGFLCRLPKRDLLNQLHMFSEAFDPEEAAARVAGLSAWFMTEQFGAGLDALNGRLGLQLQHRWDRRSRVDADLQNAQLAMLRDVLHPEYAFLELLQAQARNQLGRGPSGPYEEDVPRRS
jgi:hypothetical protein